MAAGDRRFGWSPSESGRAVARQSWSRTISHAEWVCRPLVRLFARRTAVGAAAVCGHRSANAAGARVPRTPQQDEQETAIYMDGRPHPPENTVHNVERVFDGEWDGDVLVGTTTHSRKLHAADGCHAERPGDDAHALARIGNYYCRPRRFSTIRHMTEPYISSTMMWIYDPSLARLRISARTPRKRRFRAAASRTSAGKKPAAGPETRRWLTAFSPRLKPESAGLNDVSEFVSK